LPLPHPPRAAIITGLGVVSPLGSGVPGFWDGLVAGRTAVAPITAFPAADLEPRNAAEVRDVPADDPDRAGTFALRAAGEALAHADLDGVGRGRMGVALGTTLGGMRLFERWMAREPMPPPEHVPYYAPAVRLARTLGCRGPVATPQLACASGTHAIALAAGWVRQGRADVVLAGGTDFLCRFVVAGFNCGLVLGEGAAIVVVEEAGHASRRGARLLAHLAGVGCAADATHMTAPDREGGGATRALLAALDDAGLTPAAVDFVSAHGTGTPYNDAMEAVALARVFGAGRVPVNSIKGAIGHTLGAAGALEAVLCVETLARGVIPPTAALETVDPVCAVLDLVRGAPRRRTVGAAVSTSSGFAGTNAALVFTHP